MPPDLRPIIADIADRADDFLAGSTDRVHARAGIAELVNMDYPELAPADRTRVTAGVIAVLEAEDFFGTEFVGNPFDEDGKTEEQ